MIGSTTIANNVGPRVNTRLPIPSPYEIKVKGDIGTSSVDVTVILTDTPPTGNKMLRIAVIEKAYDWPTAPGSNGQTHYEGCLLDMVPNPTGTPVTVSTVGDSQTFSFNYNTNQVNFHPSLGLTIVAFVQNDANREVLQAGYFDGRVGMGSYKTAALIESNETANLSGFISNDFSNTASLLFRITGQVPAGWNVAATSNGNPIPINGPAQNVSVAGFDSLFFNISADPQGNGGAALLKTKMMLPSDTTLSEEVQFSVVTKSVDVLIVDRDGGMDYENYILNALAQTAYSYGVIPIQSGDLGASDLMGIPSVIWNSGITEPTLTEDDMNALSAYLDAGGNLFLNGADIAYQLADPASPYYTQNSLDFFTNYLHGSYLAHQFFTLSVDGVSGDPITNGIYQMKLFGGTGANNLGVSTGKYPNEIAPADTNATPIFTFWYSPNKVAGIRANHLNGKVVFTVFGFETIGEDSLRNKLARGIMDWFLPSTAIGADNSPQLITQLELNQNYPNPFNPETKISYALPQNGKSQKVTLAIYNQLGQQVRMLVNEFKPSGRYDVVWDGRDDSGNQVASGVYVYQIRYGDHSAARKMILMR